MKFANKAHLEFYQKTVSELNAEHDIYRQALIYTLGICEDTRRNFDRLYDRKERVIVPEAIKDGWQTGTSLKVTRLAFQLFNDGTPTALSYDDNDKLITDFDECQRYSVSDIFCCEYAPLFVEAVKVRYPEYLGE